MTYDELLEQLARQYHAEVDADRLELRLWVLVRGAQRVEARTRRHPIGIELLVVVDDELSSTTAFRPDQVELLDAAVAEVRRAFEDDGWVEAV